MNVTRFLRAFPIVPHFVVPLVLALAVCGALGGWLHEHDVRLEKAALFRQELKKANADAWDWQALWLQQAERVTKDGTTVTKTITQYHTLHDTVVAEMERAHSDGIPDLPVFLRASDSAIAACSRYQVSCTEYRRVSDSLVASLRRVIAVQESRADVKPPRWSVSGAMLYDPIRSVPALDAEAGLRAVLGFSLVVRAEDRLGETPRVYVGVRRSF